MFLHLEFTRVERELESSTELSSDVQNNADANFAGIIFREHRRKDAFLQPLIRRVLVLAPVDEHILLSRMSMKIAVENDVDFGDESRRDSPLTSTTSNARSAYFLIISLVCQIDG